MRALAPRHLAMLFEEALFALATNRLRSLLTALGVVIGVASVILMLAIGEGSRRRVTESISSLGSNQLIVQSGSANTGGLRGGAGSLPTLTLEDAAAIGELLSVAHAAPVSNSTGQVVYGGRNKATTLTGTTPAYFAVNSLSLVAGDAFSDADVRTAANVAVLGPTVARELFGTESPVGQTLRIQRQTFRVIGTLRARGQGFGSVDQDDVVLLPVTTAQRKLAGSAFPGSVGIIVVEARHPERKGVAEQEITRLLRQRHRTAVGAEDDFAVRDLSALAETLRTTSRILSLLLGAIALISLMVGGIGIMNIMLVSVSERTREIGIRMALGARPASLQGQFLVEAIVLSAAGAVIGLSLGLATGWLVGRSGVLTPVFSWASIAWAMGVAMAVGVGFGFWPARRAAALQPVEALRHL